MVTFKQVFAESLDSDESSIYDDIKAWADLYQNPGSHWDGVGESLTSLCQKYPEAETILCKHIFPLLHKIRDLKYALDPKYSDYAKRAPSHVSKWQNELTNRLNELNALLEPFSKKQKLQKEFGADAGQTIYDL